MKKLYYFITSSEELKPIGIKNDNEIKENLPKQITGYWGTPLENKTYFNIPKWNNLEGIVPTDDFGFTHLYQMEVSKNTDTVNLSNIKYRKNVSDILNNSKSNEEKKQQMLTYLSRINSKDITAVIYQINNSQDLIWLYKCIGLAPNSIFLDWHKFTEIFDGIEITPKGFSENLNEYDREQLQSYYAGDKIKELCYLDNQMAAFECPTLAVFNPDAVTIKHQAVKFKKPVKHILTKVYNK